MERKTLAFTPQWEGPIEGWVVNFISKSVWRVSPQFDFDDLYQDAYLLFLVCCDRYPTVIEAPHFMRLIQTCLRNHVHDLASARTNRSEISMIQMGPGGEEVDIASLRGERCEKMDQLMLDLALEDAPESVRKLVQELVDAPKRPRKKRRLGVRETTNEFLCRIAGCAKWDISSYLRNLIEGEETCIP